MRILILGGTRFVGRAVTEAALGRGDAVTLFNRGQTNPGLYPGIETVTGDRATDLSADPPGLAGREWDAVIDVAGYDPGVVERSAGAFADTAGRYVFVSSVSVYANQTSRDTQREDSPVRESREDMTDPGERYGARKAAAERVVADVYGDRALIPRPGLIVGPHDPTDRFPYWPRRVARGGTVLAPGDPADPVQFIDVRDLAAWIADSCHDERSGTFNLTGEPRPFGRFLDECRASLYSDARPRWVPSERLLAAGVDPAMGVPLWIGYPELRPGFNDVDNAPAVAAGLTLRPAADTIRDTLAWDAARGGPPPGTDGLPAAEEERLLAL